MKAPSSETVRSSAKPESGLRDGPRGYGFVSRLNHWAVALGMLASGFALEYLPLAEATGEAIMD